MTLVKQDGLDDAEAMGRGPGVIDSSRLFAGANEVRILHDGQLYRLRVTRNGKLILNK